MPSKKQKRVKQAIERDTEPSLPARNGFFRGCLRGNTGALTALIQFLGRNGDDDFLALRSLTRSDREAIDTMYFQELCKLRSIEVDRAGPFHAYQASSPSFYYCQIGVDPGGMRRWDVFSLRSLDELEQLVRLECSAMFCLSILLVAGEEMSLQTFQQGGRAGPCLYLQEFIRITFKNGSTIWFEDVREEAPTYGEDDDEFIREDGILCKRMSGSTCTYKICCNAESYTCPVCGEATLSCNECWEYSDEQENVVDKVELETRMIPRLIGRPLRVGESFEEYSYGHISEEGHGELGDDWRRLWNA